MINLTEVNDRYKYANLLKEISNTTASNCNFIGIVVLFIYSKDVFMSNKDLPRFIFELSGIEYKNYVFKVRTTLVAKFTRYLCSLGENEINQIKKRFIAYFVIDNKSIATKKHENENDKLKKWLNR